MGSLFYLGGVDLDSKAWLKRWDWLLLPSKVSFSRKAAAGRHGYAAKKQF